MQSSFPYFDILIFGIIAVFLILRLRNILGTKTDTNNQDINKRETNKNFSNIVPFKEKKENGNLKEIRFWNPEILRDIVPLKSLQKDHYKIRLSKNLVDYYRDHKIEEKLSFIQFDNIHVYRVKKHDTIYQIARKFRVKVKSILKNNRKIRPKSLRIGSRIIIPVPSVKMKKNLRS